MAEYGGHPESRPSCHGGSHRPALPLSDRQVQRLVLSRLAEHPHTAFAEISVEVQNRVAILKGTVRSAAVRDLAHRLAGSTTGVFDVSDRLMASGEP